LLHCVFTGPGAREQAQLVIAFFVVCLSAFFAGSTLGLLSLDKVGLEIVMQASEDPKERKYAGAPRRARSQGRADACCAHFFGACQLDACCVHGHWLSLGSGRNCLEGGRGR